MDTNDRNFNFGWVKISRKIMQLPGYFDEPFDRAHCMLDLMLLAEWKPSRSFYIRGHLVTIKRGQVAVSIRDLSARWKISVNTVNRRLNDFKKLGLIDVESSKLSSIITIRNYDDDEYTDEDCNHLTLSDKEADEDTPANTPTDTPTDTSADTPADTPTNTPAGALSLRNNKNKKKNNNPKNPKNSCACEEGDAGDVFIDCFFADNRQASIDELCRTWSITQAQIKALAGECVMEWKLTGEEFTDDFPTLARRLIGHMRAKQKYIGEEGIKIPGAPQGTVDIVEIDGQTIYLGAGEKVTPRGRTYNDWTIVPLSAPPRPSNIHWWCKDSGRWEDYY